MGPPSYMLSVIDQNVVNAVYDCMILAVILTSRGWPLRQLLETKFNCIFIFSYA